MPQNKIFPTSGQQCTVYRTDICMLCLVYDNVYSTWIDFKKIFANKKSMSTCVFCPLFNLMKQHANAALWWRAEYKFSEPR